MANKSIRLGSTLTFDDKTERDLIEVAERLNGSHKMAEFMSNVFRLAVENPELIVKSGDRVGYGKLMKTMNNIGMSPNRMKYIERIEKDIKKMVDNSNKIYDLCEKMYVLMQVGKRLGVEDKTKNLEAASFIIEKNARELAEILNCDVSDLESCKNKSMEERAEDIVEYILETYDGMLGEYIKVEKSATVPVQVSREDSIDKSEVKTVERPADAGMVINNTADVVGSTIEKEYENAEVEFGSEGLGALSSFFD